MVKPENPFECPWCGITNRACEILGIATSEILVTDPILATEPLRFLPSRFDPDGWPLDPEGDRCLGLACPGCRNMVPADGLEREIVNANLPAEGLHSLTHLAGSPDASRWFALPVNDASGYPPAVVVVDDLLVRITSERDPAARNLSFLTPDRPVFVET